MAASTKIQFFGEADCDKDGNITSEMPSWYLERHIEELEESINRKETALKFNRIVSDQVPRMQAEVKAEKEKLKKIRESKPVVEGAAKDRCAKTYESLKKQIRESMPTRKQAKDGLANPYDELKRLKEKHITISPEMAASLGVKSDHGKISGDEANKCFQILGKVLGEQTNPESLRRDGTGDAYQSMHDLTKLILEGRETRE